LPRLKLKGIALLPSIAALLLVALTVSLGNWQTRRAEEKIALQAERDQAAARAPVMLDARALAAPDALLGRRLIAEGRFLERYSVFIDNRSYRGQAGFHVLTPFRLEGLPQPILVLRGWVPQDPAARGRLPTLVTPAAQVRIEALAQRDLDQVLELMKAAPPGPEDRLWQNASIAAMSQWSGLALLPIVLRQTNEVPVPFDERAERSVLSSGSPASSQTGQVMPSASPAPPALTLVRDWPSPGAGVDKHRAYAFQWYSMAVLVTSLWFIFFWRSRQPRS
jgi:cytochrome oxidase assembly protein ShyY1